MKLSLVAAGFGTVLDRDKRASQPHEKALRSLMRPHEALSGAGSGGTYGEQLGTGRRPIVPAAEVQDTIQAVRRQVDVEEPSASESDRPSEPSDTVVTLEATRPGLGGPEHSPARPAPIQLGSPFRPCPPIAHPDARTVCCV